MRTLLLLALTLVTASRALAEQPFRTGKLVEKVACLEDQTQTYTLYLPSSYEPGQKFPLLFIFDPRGRSVLAANLFVEAAEKYGWILLSSNDTRSDGPWEPNERAVNAMYPEAEKRFSVDRRRMYATGFSGGSTVAFLVGQSNPKEIAGVIGCGGPFPWSTPPKTLPFAYFNAVGNIDFNFGPAHEIDQALSRIGAMRRLEIFEGRHQWMPSSLATEAVEWMEVLAMKDGRRARSPGLISQLLSGQVNTAEKLAAEGQALDALERYESIDRTYDGLADLSSVRAAIGALRKSREVADERKRRRFWDEFETRGRDQAARAMANLGSELQVPLQRLIADLGIVELKKKAAQDSYRGRAARRVLESIYVQTSFYVSNELLIRKSYQKAALVLSAANAIREDNPVVWYNLACAWAQSGHRKKAVESLKRAIETGFKDRKSIETDPDLESIRHDPGFAALLARL